MVTCRPGTVLNYICLSEIYTVDVRVYWDEVINVDGKVWGETETKQKLQKVGSMRVG